MKSFKEFIIEMPESGVHAYELDDDEIKPPGKFDHEEDIGSLNSLISTSWRSIGTRNNYNLLSRSWKLPHEKKVTSRPHHFMAVTDDDHVHFSTRGGNTKDGYFISNETRKHPDADITAPDFYKAILHSEKAPKGIQSGHSHSEGGSSIWKRLSNDPELHVTHHRKADGKEIKLHKGDDWEKNYDQEEPTYFRAKLK